MRLSTLTATVGAALLGAPVLSAQYVATPVLSNFNDISGTGTSLGLATQEDQGALFPIGFNFTFYGAPVTAMSATTNGYLTTGGDLTDFTQDCPAANTEEPNGIIAPFFADLSLVDHGEIYFQTFGTSPNQLAVIQWEDSSTFDSSLASLTFQVQLYENGDIQLQYATLSDPAGLFPVGADNAFVGLESPDSSTALEIACNPGAPVLASNTGYLIEPVLPYISAPDQVVSGDAFQITGQADPSTLYAFAWGLSNGPLGPIPSLGGVTLDLPINFRLNGTGFVPASGDVASDVMVAPSGFNFTKVYWQCITIGGFNPISNVKVSNSSCTILRDGVRLAGSLDSAGAADHYTFPGSIGDIISIHHCRTDNTGMGTGTLDPYVCLVSPSGVIAAFDDESGGACLVDGPFSASQIVNYVALENGTWTVVASAYQGFGDEIGTYELELIAPGAMFATLAIDEGPICAGQLSNPATKLIGTMGFGQQSDR